MNAIETVKTLSDRNLELVIKVQGDAYKKQVQFIADPWNYVDRIQSHFIYDEKITKYHIFNEVTPIWASQYTNISIWFRLPFHKLKYGLFNLLHLLEHCLLCSDHILHSNGVTMSYHGLM